MMKGQSVLGRCSCGCGHDQIEQLRHEDADADPEHGSLMFRFHLTLTESRLHDTDPVDHHASLQYRSIYT